MFTYRMDLLGMIGSPGATGPQETQRSPRMGAPSLRRHRRLWKRRGAPTIPIQRWNAVRLFRANAPLGVVLERSNTGQNRC